MKHFVKLFLLSLALFCGVQMSAQYYGGDWYVSPKISFADYSDRNDWSGYSISKIPPISIAVEKGLNDYISVGGLMGYNRDKYVNDTLLTNTHKYTSFGAGALVSLHWAGWLEKVTNYKIYLGDWDFYFSGSILMVWDKKKEVDVWNDTEERLVDSSSSNVNVRLRPIVGVRYFVADDFCMLLEVGKGNLGMVTTGISWRF
ncbi:MAG: outer membrane beta-barrel protein [Marinilabiliaceae bacterium]|nr:outer membrane beta-barrel protein [Marinilabiliaceae bacterium]